MPCIRKSHTSAYIPWAPLCGVLRTTQMTSNTRRVMLQFYGSNTLRCGKLKISLWLEPISYHQIMCSFFFLSFRLCSSALPLPTRYFCDWAFHFIRFSAVLRFFNDCTRRHRAPEQSSSNRNNFEWTPSALFAAGSSFSTHTFFDSCRFFRTTHAEISIFSIFSHKFIVATIFVIFFVFFFFVQIRF